MDIQVTRFKKEWELYKNENNHLSAQQILDKCGNPMKYNREYISLFKSGKKKLVDSDFAFFSKLFGIRQEYLSGKDSYRTEEDKILGDKNQKDIYYALHRILVALGYADFRMEDYDYDNHTFPTNTKAFIESIKEPLQEKDILIICDVNNDRYISMKNDFYDIIALEIIDFIEYKLSKLFKDADPIPEVISENDDVLLKPKNSLELKDGTCLDFETKYIPTSNL